MLVAVFFGFFLVFEAALTSAFSHYPHENHYIFISVCHYISLGVMWFSFLGNTFPVHVLS